MKLRREIENEINYPQSHPLFFNSLKWLCCFATIPFYMSNAIEYYTNIDWRLIPIIIPYTVLINYILSNSTTSENPLFSEIKYFDAFKQTQIKSLVFKECISWLQSWTICVMTILVLQHRDFFDIPYIFHNGGSFSWNSSYRLACWLKISMF